MYTDRVQPGLQAGSTANSGGGASTAPNISEIELVSATEITITWGDLSGEQAYIVQRSLNGSTWATINTTANNVTSYADTGLTAETKYYYRVAVDGTMDYSNVVSGTTAAAGGGGGTLGVVSTFAAASGGTSSIDLTWVDSPDEEYYLIERSTDGGTTYNRLVSVAGGSTSYSDAALSTSTQYHYRICAFDNLQASSAWSEANATTDAAAAPQAALVGHWQGSTFDTVDDEWDGVNTGTDRFTKTSGTAASVISNWEGTGLQAVSFPAGARYDFQYSTVYDGLQPGTSSSNRGALYVVYRAGADAANRVILRYEDQNLTASRVMFYVNPSGDAFFFSDRGIGSSQLNMGATDDTNVNVLGATRGPSGTTVITTINDASDVSGSVDATGSDADDTDNLVIGEDGKAIEIAEILHYNGSGITELTQAHHDSVMLYLNSKYGIV